jgi:hypothetical protein
MLSMSHIIKACENLHVEERHQLKMLFQKCENLFDGTLGEFSMESISLQLMDPNFKLIHGTKIATKQGNCKIGGHWTP